MMTKTELFAKNKILDILNKQGYPTYSQILEKFHINLTDDPEVVAYMEPGKGRIVINRDLHITQVSLIVRHEILHEYLDHMLRMERKLGKDVWNNRTSSMHQASNIAGDYEISNRGYTPEDKITAKQIFIGKKKVEGLVTDIDHPEWVNLSLEEIYDKVTDEMDKELGNAEQQLIRIGDKGDEIKQKEEAIKRASEAIIDDADDDISQDIQGLADEASSLTDKADQIQSDVFPDNNLIGDLNKINKRLEDIKNTLISTDYRDKINRENDLAIDRIEQNAKAAADKKFKERPLEKFVTSLNRFIRDELGYERGSSYSKINKTYANTGIIRPGKTRRAVTKIPTINVYFDASGSWTSNPEKWKLGERGLATLQQYVKQGKLKINRYYFSDYNGPGKSIFSDPESASGGNSGSIKSVLEHIKSTQPDNVIIMTDSDPSDSYETVYVPGAVWFLFVDGTSPEFEESLAGKKLTKKIELKSKGN